MRGLRAFPERWVNRRGFLACSASVAALGALGAGRGVAAAPAVEERLRALEAAARGRLGVQVIDTGSGVQYGYRADERFKLLSSFKLLACALVLHRVERGEESLARRIRFGREALVPWSPVTEPAAGGEALSLGELCAATITTSDNTAANLILASYGGPAALTAYLRTLGDTVTRLDRIEPMLNTGLATDGLDTSSPRAIAETMRTLLFGDALAPASRTRLAEWLLANTTGDRRLKAGLPAGWRIGDKTGTNATDANDIGVIWPPGRAPLIVTAYLAESAADAATRETTLAAVGRLVSELGG